MDYTTWRLDTQNQTLVFLSHNKEIPECIYWGKKLYQKENLRYLALSQRRACPRATFDNPTVLSLCPQSIKGWIGQEGASSEHIKYPFIIENILQTNQKLQWELFAKETRFRLIIQIECVENAIKLLSHFLDKDKKPYKIPYLSTPVIPITEHSIEMKDFAGRWCKEFQEQITLWNLGGRLRQSLEGRTSHHSFPAIIVPEIGATNCQGNVYGLCFAWSGGHKMLAEEVIDGRRQIQFSKIGPSSNSGDLYISYSSEGFNGLMNHFHTLVRKHIIKSSIKPLVIYNCWEALYFNHDILLLKKLAKKAAHLGAELFVLDDGWFKNRNDDTSSLGDWIVDQNKFPDGLFPLIEYIKSLNMSFGIWLEPEMISPKSDLFKKHPDWVLGITSSLQMTARHQYVLDLSKKEVFDYIFDSIDTLLSKYDITYIKWDHNRPLVHASQEQTEQLYKLLTKILKKYPKLNIESCASGGARLDYGILNFTNRVWLSDSNDAHERAKIQNEAILFLPPEITGSHVGPRECHTSSRVLSMSFRAWVAAQRHIGFEMDLNELDDKEIKILQYVTTWWKLNREWRFQGKTYRLENYDKEILSEINVSIEQDKFVLFSVQFETLKQSSNRSLKLTGLLPQINYQLKLLTPENFHFVVNSQKNTFLLNNEQDFILSGAVLMQIGLYLPNSLPNTIWVIEGKKVDFIKDF